MFNAVSDSDGNRSNSSFDDSDKDPTWTTKPKEQGNW